MKHVDVLIIGGGPAGISAAIWLKRLGINCLLIEKQKTLGGQLSQIQNKIIDYPGLHANNGKELKKMFLKHFYDIGCPCKLNTNVLSVDHFARTAKIQEANQVEVIHFNYLLLATGSTQRFLGIPGEKEMISRGENYSATVDSHLFKNKTVAVVGGGDRAFEGAILLAEAGANVYLIHRSQTFKARIHYIKSAARKSNIEILTDTHVTAIHGDKQVESIEITGKDGTCSTLNVEAVLIRIGIKPSSELVSGIVKTENGVIATNETGKTSNSFIYAAGDICLKPIFSSIASAVGQGAVVANHISSFLSHQPISKSRPASSHSFHTARF